MTTQTQSRRPAATPRLRLPASLPDYNWPRVILAALFIGYWLFARSWERIDGNLILAGFFFPELTPSQAAAATFSPWIVWLVELFHPRVLRHFLPAIAGWWLAVQAAISLMQVLYNCPDRRTAAEFLRRQRRSGISGMELPYAVSPKNLADARQESILLRVGGPVRVQIPDGHAAVTERNARFLRVLPPGVHDLGRFEYLLDVVDLQPQERTAKDVLMLTREGIPVRADIGLTFRIDPGENAASHKRPYPFSEEAVRRAAYSGVVGASGKVSSWAEGPLGKVRGALAGLISEDSLDDLLAAGDQRDAHHLLVEAVMRKVWDSLPKDGVKPLRLRISALRPPAAVSRQYTEYWLANQRKEDILARANGTADLIQEAETAHAEAEIAMIQAIIEGVRRAQQEAGANLSGYLLALRLLEALRQMFQFSAHSLQRLGEDTEQLLSDIDAVTERLSGLEETMRLPQPKFNPSSPD